MRFVAVYLIGVACAAARIHAADLPAPGVTLLPSEVRGNEGDEAWLEILASGAPQKMDWKGEKPPTQADVDAHKKSVAEQLLRDADKAKAFYTKFPNHPKADAARAKEKKLREDASVYGPGDAKPATAPARDPEFDAKLQMALGQVEAVKAFGPVAMSRQYEDIGRRLAREYPKRDEPFMLMEMATRYAPPNKVVALYREIVANAPPGSFKSSAAAELAARDVINKTISLSGPTLKGESFDLQKFRGKVVLVDFWATWCPACVSLTPGMLALYEQIHDKGFEIVGVNLDEDAAALKQYVARNKVPWTQIPDITQNNSMLSSRFRPRGIPLLFLVDKTGKVRDIDPLDRIVEKIQFLLAE